MGGAIAGRSPKYGGDAVVVVVLRGRSCFKIPHKLLSFYDCTTRRVPVKACTKAFINLATSLPLHGSFFTTLYWDLSSLYQLTMNQTKDSFRAAWSRGSHILRYLLWLSVQCCVVVYRRSTCFDLWMVNNCDDCIELETIRAHAHTLLARKRS